MDANLQSLPTGVLQRSIMATRSPLILTDNSLPDNPIVYANEAFLDLCGYSAEEIIGKNCRFLQGDDTDKKSVKEISKAVKTGEHIRINLKNYRKDGKMFWNDLLVSPIVDETGKITHFIGMQLDITDRISYMEKLEATQKRLRESNAELEQFTYAASHDLQEPLRMVNSYLQLLNKRYSADLDDDARLFLDFGMEGASRMQQLIDDLLSLSRITSSQRKFKATNLVEAVERATFNLKLLIEETGAVIHVDDLPTVNADGPQIVQLLQNLIGNAIKYRHPDRTPEITIKAEKSSRRCVISIVDNGIGIDEQYHKRIFEVFQRLHTRAEYSGTGVGLALCAKIVERHNGKLWVESNQNSGSTFKFSLPSGPKGDN